MPSETSCTCSSLPKLKYAILSLSEYIDSTSSFHMLVNVFAVCCCLYLLASTKHRAHAASNLFLRIRLLMLTTIAALSSLLRSSFSNMPLRIISLNTASSVLLFLQIVEKSMFILYSEFFLMDENTGLPFASVTTSAYDHAVYGSNLPLSAKRLLMS